MAAYHWVDDLVTCGLTACRPGSAPGPTLGSEYRRTLPPNCCSYYCLAMLTCIVTSLTYWSSFIGGLSVGLSVTSMYCGKTADLVEMQFEVVGWLG